MSEPVLEIRNLVKTFPIKSGILVDREVATVHAVEDVFNGAREGRVRITAPVIDVALKVGDVAPDFTLTDTGGNPVKLSDYRGKKNVVLAFYVLAFTGG